MPVQKMKCKVSRLVITEELRTVTLKVVGQRTDIWNDITLDVPAVQPIHPGDEVLIDVTWPAY